MGCKFLLAIDNVSVFDISRETIITGCQELHSAKLWQLLLQPELDAIPPSTPGSTNTTLGAFIAYDIPSLEVLVCYFHASD